MNPKLNDSKSRCLVASVILRKNILTWNIVELQLEEGIDGPNPDQEEMNWCLLPWVLLVKQRRASSSSPLSSIFIGIRYLVPLLKVVHLPTSSNLMGQRWWIASSSSTNPAYFCDDLNKVTEITNTKKFQVTVSIKPRPFRTPENHICNIHDDLKPLFWRLKTSAHWPWFWRALHVLNVFDDLKTCTWVPSAFLYDLLSHGD